MRWFLFLLLLLFGVFHIAGLLATMGDTLTTVAVFAGLSLLTIPVYWLLSKAMCRNTFYTKTLGE
jgi:hypothetical protein